MALLLLTIRLQIIMTIVCSAYRRDLEINKLDGTFRKESDL